MSELASFKQLDNTHTQQQGLQAFLLDLETSNHLVQQYGLKQAPREWYERLSNFLLSHGYERGMIDKTLFIKRENSEIILVQIYVDDIIFGATKDSLCEEFVVAMQGEFEKSMMGELSFFLGLQVM